MRAAVQCAGIAKEMFEALRKCDHLTNIQVAASVDSKDLEYLEAACVLHNIGISVGKKGYHKHSYSIITNGNHLRGYGTEDVKPSSESAADSTTCKTPHEELTKLLPCILQGVSRTGQKEIQISMCNYLYICCTTTTSTHRFPTYGDLAFSRRF